MKKAIITTTAIVACLVILYTSGVVNSLTLFLLAGIVPGTKYVVPSTFMLLIMTSAAWVLLFTLMPFDFFRREAPSRKSEQQPKRRLPKRRYERI